MIRHRVTVRGVVQGVGFRPFVYKTALLHDLNGFVRNQSNGVEIEIQGEEDRIEAYLDTLRCELPPLARIDEMVVEPALVDTDCKTFEILHSSETSERKSALVSPDITVCSECLTDMRSEGRYHGYFAVNCTNCGPRYSIIQTVPYDRANTSMAAFTMCEACEKAYNDPLDRRYHAQPISCNYCGPKLSHSIEETAAQIKKGKIVAIKGIGGFHIVCDATNDDAVQRLRAYKNRPHKPFALMCKDLMMVKSFAWVSAMEETLLASKEAPVVLMQKKAQSILSDAVAPGIERIGAMLAYAPLQHLLFDHLDFPIVATSANLGDEPIITDKETLEHKLPLVSFILDHNRPIVNAVDDSVVQVCGGELQMLRLARGYAPKVIKLPFKSEQNILAVGANQKNAIALVLNDTMILSPHIGDLDSVEAFGYFERTVETFGRFYDFSPDLIVHDKHSGYETSKWAQRQNVETLSMQHHLAHIYACKAEYGLEGEHLAFSFDGTGYGEDGTLWGGEVFVGDERKYHFKPLKLLGGEKAIKEPRRVALSLLFDALYADKVCVLDLPTVQAFTDEEIRGLYHAYEKSINAPLSSSVGRLFDAAASLAGIVQEISYEGQSGLLCEGLWDASVTQAFPYAIQNGIIEINLISPILNEKLDAARIVSMFFNTLREIVMDIARQEKLPVILTGGVFQNRVLSELLINAFEKEGIAYYLQRQTPVNDASIALGQAYYACLNERNKSIGGK